MGAAVDLGPQDDEQELVAEVTDVENSAEAAAAISAVEALDIAATWIGEPGRSALSGLAIVTEPESAEVTWIPGHLLDDVDVHAALGAHSDVRGHRIKPLMRSLLDVGVSLDGIALDTAIAAYLIDPAEASYDLADLIEKYTEFARPSDDAAGSGQLDLDGTSMSDAELAGRDALAVHHLVEPIARVCRRRGWPSCTRPSRTRW